MKGGFWRGVSVAAGVGLAAIWGADFAGAQESANSASFWLQEQARQDHTRPSSRQQPQRVRRLVPNAKLARPTIWRENSHEPGPPLTDPAPEPGQAAQPAPTAPGAPPAATPADAGQQPAAPAPAQQPPQQADVAPPPQQPEAAQPVAPPPVAAPLPGARLSVAVVGDNLGYWLGQGLADSQADAQAGAPGGARMALTRKTKDSSGLVRDDFYDWQKNLREILNGPEKFDAVVVMIGSNDRQELRDGAGRHEPLSPRWRELYAARVDAFLAAIKEKNIPVFWVGMPIMRAEKYSSEIGQLNEIYRARVEAAGGGYVDVWDAFADENGKFSVFGPDVNGQTVKLRTSDGIHFTKPGARKLAYFTEQNMRALFDRKPADPLAPAPAPAPPPSASQSAAPGAPPPPAPGPQAALPAPAAPAVPAAPVAPPPPPKPLAGPILPLTAPAIAPGGELAGAPNAQQQARANVARDAVISGSPPQQPGRADDFSWPRR
ncbi:MAG: SGNH family hydrolase [Beijerinckiaceae bacterium]